MRFLRSVAAVVLVMGTAGALAGCDSTSAAKPTIYRYTIPKGATSLATTDRAPVIFPDHLVVKVGDSIVITNDDDYDQEIGPYRVKSQAVLKQRFATPGTLEGTCSMSANGTLKVTVVPADAAT